MTNEITLTAHDLSDRKVNEVSLRNHESIVRWLYEGGSSIKSIASVFGKSYEWTRRVAKNVAYDYDDVTVEVVSDEIPNLVIVH